MTNLAANPVYAERLVQLKASFWKTRVFYEDTDEEVWKPGNTKRYRREDYIRPRRSRGQRGQRRQRR